jgi:hypothetical protein
MNPKMREILERLKVKNPTTTTNQKQRSPKPPKRIPPTIAEIIEAFKKRKK